MDAIDTSSLSAFVRYYLPFDKNSRLFDLMKYKIESKEIIVIDKVCEEGTYFSKGMVIKAIPYIKEFQLSTIEYLPDRSFFNDTENRFVHHVLKSKMTDEEFEIKKTEFLESADAKLILFCKHETDPLTKPRIITEETEGGNDNKLFKKIPAICKMLGITTITLPQLLEEWGGIDSILNKED